MTFIKKHIPLALCFIFGVLTLGSYYVPNKASENYLEVMNKWENIVAGFAFLLGLFSLFFSHYNKIRRKVDGWGYSLFVFVGFLIMVIPAITSKGIQMDGATLTGLGWNYRFLFNALSGTMFSVLAFYIVSTAYRAFRIKSPQAGVLFAAAFILIVGKVPLGQIMWEKTLGWTHVGISQIVQWLMEVPVVAGRRGIMMGLAIGGIVTGLKIIFGIERQYMGKD
ncbi:MAG TPA: hypothetical protein DCZ92_08260 [Elusimicrobia bacterium]|nr:MAG: hypothetical protein A2016_09780 [Elusimicrobia bacterium GWF2_62_30]HBA60798.1 hypothetical protein [Elusimicrobiota bacterium]